MCLRLLRLTLTLCLTFTLSQANAGPTQEEMLEVLETYVEGEGFSNEAVEALDIPDHQAAIYMDHFEKMYANGLVLDALATEMVNNYSLFENVPEHQVRDYARQFGSAMTQALVVAGIARLNADEQRSFFETASFMLDILPADECAKTMRGELSAVDAALTEVKAMRSLSDMNLASYLAVTRHAVIAEIQELPVFIPLTVTEQEFAEAAFADAFEKALQDHPRADRLIFAADLSDRAPDADVCEFAKLTIDTAIKIDGIVGDWVMKYLSSP